MNHLKPKSDSALKQKVEEQVAKVDVQQAVREVAPPPLQNAVPGEVLHVMAFNEVPQKQDFQICWNYIHNKGIVLGLTCGTQVHSPARDLDYRWRTRLIVRR